MTFPKKDNYQIYGGDLQDRRPSVNFHKIGATDLPAEDFNQCRASIAGMTNASFLAYIKYNTSAGIIEYECAWDKVKSGMPTVSYNGLSGGYEVVFPYIVYDLRGKTHSVNLIAALANPDVDNSVNAYQSHMRKMRSNSFNLYNTINFGQPTNLLTTVDMFFF